MRRHGKKFYFGFSYFVNGRRKNLREVIVNCPADRILLESDLDTDINRGVHLENMARLIGEIRGWDLQSVKSRTTENAFRFYESR